MIEQIWNTLVKEKNVEKENKTVQERCRLENEPLVSIIIPVYNKEVYLPECLTCVSRQTWKNIEIIVVNDESTDGSTNYLQTFSGKDYRLKCYYIKHSGVSFARNEGLKHAQGRFIAFVDADDLIPPDYIESLLLAIGNADISMCQLWAWNQLSDSVRIDSCETEKYTRTKFLKPKSRRWKLCSNVYAKLYKSSFLQQNNLLFEESLDYGEDTLFFFKCLCYTNLINTTDRTYYIYRAGVPASLVDMNSHVLKKNRVLLSFLQQLSCLVNDCEVCELIAWKQMIILFEIGKMESFLESNERKGSVFFSCAKEYNLGNYGYTGDALTWGELITRFTLRLGLFLPFRILIRIIYRNAKEKRQVFLQKTNTAQLNTINKLTDIR